MKRSAGLYPAWRSTLDDVAALRHMNPNPLDCLRPWRTLDAETSPLKGPEAALVGGPASNPRKTEGLSWTAKV
jgi:hypothetical protein